MRHGRRCLTAKAAGFRWVFYTVKNPIPKIAMEGDFWGVDFMEIWGILQSRGKHDKKQSSFFYSALPHTNTLL